MLNLLQDLWDQFEELVTTIDDLIDDQSVDEEPFKSLREIIIDTGEMVKLRIRLDKAGVQNIGGKFYSANQSFDIDAQGEKKQIKLKIHW